MEHAFLTAGTYDVTLTVTDLQGLQDTATVTVTVTGDEVENTKPTAKASATPSQAQVGESIDLSADGSTDAETPDGLTYSWDFDNGGTTADATGRDVTTSYAEEGTYTATVTVTDGGGLTDTASVEITVGETTGNEDTTDPTVQMEVRPQRVLTRQAVIFDASGSSDDVTAPEDLEVFWNKGDGGKNVDATGTKVKVRYAEPGRYKVTVAVRDEAGNTAFEQQRVRVLRYSTCNARSVNRQGAWKVKRSKAALRGVYCDTSSKRRGPDRLSYSFTGNTLKIRYGKAADGGKAQVFIDGKRVPSLNFKTKGKAITFGNQRTYAKLGKGRHKVKVVLKRGTGYLEGFVTQN